MPTSLHVLLYTNPIFKCNVSMKNQSRLPLLFTIVHIKVNMVDYIKWIERKQPYHYYTVVDKFSENFNGPSKWKKIREIS